MSAPTVNITGTEILYSSGSLLDIMIEAVYSPTSSSSALKVTIKFAEPSGSILPLIGETVNHGSSA